MQGDVLGKRSVLSFAMEALVRCNTNGRTPRRWEFSEGAMDELRHSCSIDNPNLHDGDPPRLFGVPIAILRQPGRIGALIVDED